MDQYKSQIPGWAFTSKGLATSLLTYASGTLFFDEASCFIADSHQVGHTAVETIESKLQFERESLGSGVLIQAYHTANGLSLIHI